MAITGKQWIESYVVISGRRLTKTQMASSGSSKFTARVAISQTIRTQNESGGKMSGFTRTLPTRYTPTRLAGCTAGIRKRSMSPKRAPTTGMVISGWTPTNQWPFTSQWVDMTRPAPGPGGLRRPLWFKRPLRPDISTYYLTEAGGKQCGLNKLYEKKPAVRPI
jgi:hypothetical protein